MKFDYDFSGWATRPNIKCGDGRTIMPNAFSDQSGEVVPLVWNHDHSDSFNVLGHALLEDKDGGVYTYCKFNSTESGQNAKALVEDGDIQSLSIYANKLTQSKTGQVLHGAIREVSLVLAGANPGAKIDSVIRHSEDGEDEEDGIIIHGFDPGFSLSHSDDSDEEKQEDENMDNEKQKSLEEVFDELTDEQKDAVYTLIGLAVQDAQDEQSQEEPDDNEEYDDEYDEDYDEEPDDEDEDYEGDDEEMQHNVFDMDDDYIYTDDDAVLSHSEFDELVADSMSDASTFGSVKQSFIAHAAQDYGIENINYLFPDAAFDQDGLGWIQRDQGWITKFLDQATHTKKSRIKSIYADITEDEARAKGYITGKFKKNEFFKLIKRATQPTTVYKKQKLDRDDVADIVDFDVIVELKGEMKLMLNEEVARAGLVGDGRDEASEDKINPECIRPVWTDSDLYTIKGKVEVESTATTADVASEMIDQAVRSRIKYKGTGTPTLFTTEEMYTAMLLLKDKEGRRIYKDANELATAMRVKEVVPVEIMNGLVRKTDDGDFPLLGIVINPADYKYGADQGGEIAFFDDFDIDYNQMKYLIETRCSGALHIPYSAIVLEKKVKASA